MISTAVLQDTLQTNREFHASHPNWRRGLPINAAMCILPMKEKKFKSKICIRNPTSILKSHSQKQRKVALTGVAGIGRNPWIKCIAAPGCIDRIGINDLRTYIYTACLIYFRHHQINYSLLCGLQLQRSSMRPAVEIHHWNSFTLRPLEETWSQFLKANNNNQIEGVPIKVWF